MAAYETMRAQLVCDFKDNCPNTVIIHTGGMQKVRREGRDSHDWSVIDGQDVCPDCKSQALRASAKRKEEANVSA